MVRAQGIGFTSTSTNVENLTTYSDSHFLNELPGFLDNIDSLINRVSSRRTIIGAYQNRLEVALNNNHSYEMNLMAANSQINDVNYANKHRLWSVTKENAVFPVFRKRDTAPAPITVV